MATNHQPNLQQGAHEPSSQRSNRERRSENDSNESTKKEGAGVLMRTIKPGDGVNFPRRGDTCMVHYEGFFESTGEKFDSSRDRNQIFVFQLGCGQVIEGWDVTIGHLSLGQVVELTIPHTFAYGELGYPPLIPPRSTLIYKVELVDFASS